MSPNKSHISGTDIVLGISSCSIIYSEYVCRSNLEQFAE